MEDLKPFPTAGGRGGQTKSLLGTSAKYKDSAICPRYIYLSILKTYAHTDTCLGVFTAPLSIAAKNQKQPNVNQWMTV